MKDAELKRIAKKAGVGTWGKNKADVIREIQQKEGNFPCYGTAADYCDQLACLWRSDCLK